MRYSWGSMLRTIRAAPAVLLLGGIGLTVPPQTRDMLAFLEDGRIWPAISFAIALVMLAGSAWFWSRAALAARFGIGDRERYRAGTSKFDWVAFTWLPRLMLLTGFVIGTVIAAVNKSIGMIMSAVVLGIIGVVLAVFRSRNINPASPPALRYGLFVWIIGGMRGRLRALLQAAPFGAGLATVMLAMGLVHRRPAEAQV